MITGEFQVQKTRVIVKEVRVSLEAVTFCCAPMERAWNSVRTWAGDANVVACPFCKALVIKLPDKEQTVIKNVE